MAEVVGVKGSGGRATVLGAEEGKQPWPCTQTTRGGQGWPEAGGDRLAEAGNRATGPKAGLCLCHPPLSFLTGSLLVSM